MSQSTFDLHAGWIVMDDEHFQYLSGIMMSANLPADSKGWHHGPTIANTSNRVQVDEEAAVLESQISQIKDLFPDFGKGFLSACLEVYNHNSEEVIQRILEGTLHEDLQSLETSPETVPVPKYVSSTRVKGKGKGNEPIAPSRKPLPVHVEQQSGGSSSSGGRFIRKFKSEAPSNETLDTRDKRDLEKVSALASQYEYEDEYDDSFDDLGLGGLESGFEESEALEDGLESEMGNGQNAPSSSSKWGSRRKPQFYVKDGKNYSYKVVGSVAVANAREASLVTQAQSELIYGLGRGGNLTLGAVKRLEEIQMEEEEKQRELSLVNEEKHESNPRGRGRRGRRRGRGRDYLDEREIKESDDSMAEARENSENNRGRGRRGGGTNHYRSERAMNKRFSSLHGR